MSNHPSLAFGFQFQSDGTTNSVSINLGSGPVVYFLPSGSTTPALNGSFSTTATGVAGVACDGGLAVTSASILLGILTVNLSGTQVSGQAYTIQGTLLF